MHAAVRTSAMGTSCFCSAFATFPLRSHPGRISGGKAQGSESTEGKITGCLLQTARAGRQRSCRWQSGEAIWHACHVAKSHPFPEPPLPASHSFSPLSQVHSPFCCQSLVHSHRICLAGKGMHRMRICKATLGMSQPHISLLPLPKLYKPGPYPQEGSESLMQSSGWQELRCRQVTYLQRGKVRSRERQGPGQRSL